MLTIPLFHWPGYVVPCGVYELAADNLGQKVGINVELKPEEYASTSRPPRSQVREGRDGPVDAVHRGRRLPLRAFLPELPTNQSAWRRRACQNAGGQRREMDLKKRKAIVGRHPALTRRQAYYVYVPQWPQDVAHPPYREGLQAPTTATASACGSSHGSTSRTVKRTSCAASPGHSHARAGERDRVCFDAADAGATWSQRMVGGTLREDDRPVRRDLGLDRPMYVQYFEWIGNIVLRGDFGRS